MRKTTMFGTRLELGQSSQKKKRRGTAQNNVLDFIFIRAISPCSFEFALT